MPVIGDKLRVNRKVSRVNDMPNDLHRELRLKDDSRALVRCERAAAELRYGRPVRILDKRNGGCLVALAFDATSPAQYEAFRLAVDDRHSLFLTAQRADVMGLAAPNGALVPLAGLDFADASHLGYLRGAEAPTVFEAGYPLAAEAAQLARLALLLPVAVVAEIDPDDKSFNDALSIELGDVATANRFGLGHFEIIADTKVPLAGIEASRFVVFRGGLNQRDQLAIVVGELDMSRPVPIRVHSSCITGDLFGSLKCDCGDQLRNGLKTLEKRGGGVMIYLDQEGRGTGIGAKMRAYHMQADGFDTVDADAVLGFGADERRYETAAAMLSKLGIRRVELLTNNPLKIAYLRACGVEVAGRSPVLGTVTPQNEGYLRTKAKRAGHMMDVDRLMAGMK
ncbi:GTP cyclohydrolase II [Fulvimarina manganoxydans]|uniref:GTP cyclohydrolase-2 n=2 Tax=Fulvimarina manganoxydans TaxID=937218 RepID=A0A1W2CRS8_9HYPH|nr:GTP cyclohydrolase II [Fulvimarina manganoxydans]